MKHLFSLLFCSLACTLPAQRVYYVNQAATGGAQTGLDWANAFPILQNALAAAKAGDTIWVAKGVYLPTNTIDRSIAFKLKQGVQLYGGFAGSETAPGERNWIQNETVLSGNIGDPGLRTDNSYNIVTGQGLDTTTCIDGFILRYSYSDAEGGALLLTATAQEPSTCPLIRNCRFEYNFGETGAGLNCRWNSVGHINPALKNCRFQFNVANRYGGAMYKAGPSPNDHPFIVEDCWFSDNRVVIGGNGGGVYFRESMGKSLFHRCCFERDTAISGLGGAFYYSSPIGPAEMILDSCRFVNNYANSGAGVLYDEFTIASNGLNSYFSYFYNCIFEQNYTKDGNGSAFYFKGDENSSMRLYIESCHFLKNEEAASVGNCIFETEENSDVVLAVRNSKFIGNKNDDSAGIRTFALKYSAAGTSSRCRAYFDNCVFARNSAGLQGLGNSVNTYITNCTFFQNQQYILEKSWMQEYNDSTLYNNMYVSNCIFWETASAWWMFSDGSDMVWKMDGYHIDHVFINQKEDAFLHGSIGSHAQYRVYPMFVDTANNDFRLLPCSPAVNFGDNLSATTANLITDLDGNPRIFSDRVDLGAYEAQDTCNTMPVAEAPAGFAAFQVSPNPVRAGHKARVVELAGEKAFPLHWQIRDITGRLVDEGIANDQEFDAKAPTNAGVYCLVLRRQNAALALRLVVW